MTRYTMQDLQQYVNTKAEGINGRLDKIEQDIYNLKMVDVMHDKELDKMRRKGYCLRLKKGGNEVVVKLG